jgi:hypothetical protein
MEVVIMKKINGSIEVVGKRWFQKTYGNTYHSVRVYVNNEVLTEDFTYGYEDAYRQTAYDLLKQNGYDVPDSYGDFIRMKNISFRVADVDRKKDL